MENKQLNATFNGTLIAHPAAIFIRLYSTILSPAGVGTEITAAGYVPKEVACDTTNFPVVTDGSIENAVPIPFGTAEEDWPTVIAYGVWDAAVGGNLLWWGDIDPGVTATQNAVLTVPVGMLNFTENNT